jgi:hypothetical protein
MPTENGFSTFAKPEAPDLTGASSVRHIHFFALGAGPVSMMTGMLLTGIEYGGEIETADPIAVW